MPNLVYVVGEETLTAAKCVLGLAWIAPATVLLIATCT
ncbi:hypothetical protein FH5_04131 [Priestia endophytica]|nr:hypothetical protein FH5_04131 [Priestia endophytica]